MAPSEHPGVPLGWQQSPVHAPQSDGQLPQFSPLPQEPSPQPAGPSQTPQPKSRTSATQVSSHPVSQQNESMPQTQEVIDGSLHPGVPLGWQQSPVQEPQSDGQLAHVSPASQDQLPQFSVEPQLPHPKSVTSPTQVSSQPFSQQ
jgi:hypothetical protein